MTLRAGDVVYANLDPVRGSEQSGHRPVVVISAVQMGPRAIIVPMTTKLRSWPTRIRLKVYGVSADAMCEQVRTVDIARLAPDRYAAVAAGELAEIRQTVARLIGVY